MWKISEFNYVRNVCGIFALDGQRRIGHWNLSSLVEKIGCNWYLRQYGHTNQSRRWFVMGDIGTPKLSHTVMYQVGMPFTRVSREAKMSQANTTIRRVERMSQMLFLGCILFCKITEEFWKSIEKHEKLLKKNFLVLFLNFSFLKWYIFWVFLSIEIYFHWNWLWVANFDCINFWY